MHEYKAVSLLQFVAIDAQPAVDYGVPGKVIGNKQRVELFSIQVMKKNIMPVALEYGADPMRDCVVITFLVRMGENDENIHVRNLNRG
jgi:hypothetical protein